MDRPNFKFIMEKGLDISEDDIKAFLASYREANKPNNFVQQKKQFMQSEASTSSSSSSSSSKTSAQSPKSRAEAIEKLEKLGVTIFMPDNKSINLDWVYERLCIGNFSRII